MEIQQQKQGAVTVLRPQGPLAGDDASEFRERLREVAAETLGRFVLDASGVAYVDSTALEALVDVGDELSRSGQTLRLCGVNETIRQVLTLTALASRFEYFEDSHAAVRSFL